MPLLTSTHFLTRFVVYVSVTFELTAHFRPGAFATFKVSKENLSQVSERSAPPRGTIAVTRPSCVWWKSAVSHQARQTVTCPSLTFPQIWLLESSYLIFN